MLKYQYHLIARCDDLGNFRTLDLHGHHNPMYSHFALQTKVHWSKNVLEERNCPEQIFLGSYDPDYCLLLSLSIYLEIYVSSDTNSLYLFGEGEEGNKTVNKIKNNFSTGIRKFFKEYLKDSAGVLGTHSFRKYAATWARNNGCSEDEVNDRGRWKQTRRVVQRYLDVEQEFVDARVHAALCVGGPIKYKLVDDSGVTSAWYDQYAVPGIKKHFGTDTISDVLALPLLFACMSDDLVHTVPLRISSRIRQEYEKIRVLDIDVNPVKKVLLEIKRVEDRLVINELVGDADVAGGTQQHGDTNTILLQMLQFKQDMTLQYDQIQQGFTNLASDVGAKHSTIQKKLNRIFIQPPRQATPQQIQDIEANDNIEEERATLLDEQQRTVLSAELSKTPRSLYDLWIEY